MKPKELLDRLGIREAALVSYDVSAREPYARTAVHRVLYGRRERKKAGDGRYRYEGLVPRWGERLGQTVVLVHPDKVSELTATLRRVRVPFTERTVYADW